ncbi:DNA-binding transcriptional LysR family regulator [Agromyces cerinus]|uniref:LysR family transcriptional regulator n=1 Tax=Agromyces cerinus TaxID=33878 RepID=UPI00195E9F01|nr:LysR family transcriptional regulator [Agromyces cerinus]MBM7832904.1 DNA-binding transcriptional LysR family regulator [Agromyces cerinus]
MPTRWPDLAVLELLVAIGRHGSLGRAARSVDMAQPNASRAIAGLERSLGLTLIERHSRGSRLTADGEAIAELAGRLLVGADDLLAAATARRGHHESRLELAASLTVAEYLLPAWVAGLRRGNPELDVRMRVENSTRVFELLESHEIELGFVESPGVRRGLHSRTVAVDRLVVVVSPTHAWARRSQITLDELAATPLVTREAGSGTRSTLADALDGRTPAEPSLVVASNAAVLIAAASGAGPTVLSDLATRPWVARGELVEVAVAGLDLTRRLRAVWRRGDVLSTPAATLLGELSRGRAGGNID